MPTYRYAPNRWQYIIYIYFLLKNFCVYYIDVKKVCPAEMPLRRRVSVDSSRGMSDDSSEDEDARNRNVAANRPVEQINVSEIKIFFFLKIAVCILSVFVFFRRF